ncbi:hypothetical protein F4677DRAFT_117612 [Hypoxylon crocopeplum]|nr:hypothetical protein F4677DRAFT_117612 [Hypoxylon crocopeplum]
MALNEAHKARILAHMNKEHTKELSHYLRAYNGLSASASRNAQLADMTLDAMTITSASGTHSVAIAPPLGSAADARVRLVEMSQRAQQRLGLSDIQITAYTPPRGIGAATFFGVSLYFACAATLGLVRPGTAAWDFLDAVFPFGGAPAYKWLVGALFVPVVAIHVVEAWWMARTRLTTHGVEPGSALWLMWVADTFMEGVPSMQRFDGMVEAERKKKDSAKH